MKTTTCALGLLLLSLPATLTAQRGRPFEIMDNSLLVEEAFNQEAGVFQNIFLFQRSRVGDAWSLEFTQEWPVMSQRHQFSFMVPLELDGFSLGNMQLNYRLQLRQEDESGPALSPRLSLVLPTGPDGGGAGWGLQFNLPVSRQIGDVYVHGNAGLNWNRSHVTSGLFGEETFGLLTPQFSGSVIWRARPLLHLLVESVARFEEVPADPLCCNTSYESSLLISPGFRLARNLGSHQLVLGAGVPLELVGSTPASVLLYLSYELPFRAVK